MPMEQEDFGDKLLPLPAGYKFVPTDEELVTYYLINKVLRKPIPTSSPFQEMHATQFYTSPPNISVQNPSAERVWYYFIRKELSKDIPVPEDGQGFWQSNGEKSIFDPDKNVLAFKIHLIYYSGSSPNPKKTHWSMDEYRLPIQFYTLHKLKEEWAVARLKRGRDYDLD